jgi:hypothetical protein
MLLGCDNWEEDPHPTKLGPFILHKSLKLLTFNHHNKFETSGIMKNQLSTLYYVPKNDPWLEKLLQIRSRSIGFLSTLFNNSSDSLEF